MASAGLVGLGATLLVAAATVAADEPADGAPDIALLEYLGDLVHAQQRWVGPEDMPGVGDDAAVVLDGESADKEPVK